MSLRMGFRRFFHTGLAGILVLALSQPALADTGGKPGGQMMAPNGKPIVTEAQAEQQHGEHLLQLTAQVRKANALLVSGGIGAQRYVEIKEGTTMVTSPHYDSDTGFIADDRVMGTLGKIRAVTLKVLGMVFADVASVVDNVAFGLGIIADDQKGAEAGSFHQYTYMERDGLYYSRGWWRKGVSVERRDTYGIGWAKFTDKRTGRPAAEFENHGQGKLLRQNASCHFYNDDWIKKDAYGTYQGKWAYGIEAWNRCINWLGF